jgi:hypothetical protein
MQVFKFSAVERANWATVETAAKRIKDIEKQAWVTNKAHISKQAIDTYIEVGN